MALPGPMTSTVGIRQVRADGVKLTEAMVLDVVGGTITNETTDDNLESYRLDLSAIGDQAALITALQTALTTLTNRVTVAENRCTTLESRCTALEAKLWAPTTVKVADYTAAKWEHVYADLLLAGADVTVTMPTSPAPSVGDRVRVSETSPAGGGVVLSLALKISCSFCPIDDGYYASSPHIVADNGAGYSLEGATIELEYVTNQFGSGWLIVQESCRPEPLV